MNGENVNIGCSLPWCLVTMKPCYCCLRTLTPEWSADEMFNIWFNGRNFSPYGQVSIVILLPRDVTHLLSACDDMTLSNTVKPLSQFLPRVGLCAPPSSNRKTSELFPVFGGGGVLQVTPWPRGEYSPKQDGQSKTILPQSFKNVHKEP